MASLASVAAACSSRDAIPNYDPNEDGGTRDECADQSDGTACSQSQICVAGRCQSPACGDGVTSGDEECDDGNGVDDDGCNNECVRSVCGNGYVEPHEVCDDFNTVDGDGCPSDCRGPVCGDGVIEEQEVCDGPQVGVTGQSESYSCTNDCSEKVAYVCEPCQRQKCTSYTGRAEVTVNAVAHCLEAVPPNAADPNDGAFLQQCAALVNCALRNRCGLDGGYPSLACYCGTTDAETCAMTGPADEGPCHAEFVAAARSEDAAVIYTHLTDFAFPSAWASALLDCYRDECSAPLERDGGTDPRQPYPTCAPR